VSILKHRDGAPSGVYFLSQQMTEKILKAYLVHEIKDYPKIHLIDKLVELCSKVDADFKNLKDEAIYLSDFYMPARYPSLYIDFSWREAEKAFKSATKIKEFVLKKMKRDLIL